MKRVFSLMVFFVVVISSVAVADTYTLDEVLPSIPTFADEEIQTLIDAATKELNNRGITTAALNDNIPYEEREDYIERDLVRKGDKGENVKAVQEKLLELGYLTGTADGDFGKKSEAAVSEFQQENSLEVTGMADSITQYVLFSTDAAYKINAISNTNTVEDDATREIQTVEVNNYVGYSLSSCGYTSMGGDRRDYYGDETVVLIMVSSDGTYIDPNDTDQLDRYTVVAQWPESGRKFTIVTADEGETTNIGYEEILLIVNETGDNSIPTYKPVDVNPSPDKTIHYVRNYVGRNAETIGYTAMNGNRYDQYGPDGIVRIVVKDEENHVIEDFANLKYCTVTAQNVEPNTEMTFTYDEDKPDNVKNQSISAIEIVVSMSEDGKATLEAKAVEEEELLASGRLIELYKGTYRIGTDLKAANYKLLPLSESCDIYIFDDEDSYSDEKGEWDFLYGENDASYYALRDGMYLRVKDGAAKAIISDISDGKADEFELYAGIYRIGTDLAEGHYEMVQISDSCNVHTYTDEKAFEENKGDWDFLYGKDDIEYYSLKAGMILKISDGAVNVTRK